MTSLPMPSQCPFCHTCGPFKKHALRETWWRDVPDNSRPQVRRGHMVRWRCQQCQQTHTTAPDWAASPRRMTHALTDWIQAQLAQGQTVTHIAQVSGMDHKTVRSVREQDINAQAMS